MNDNTQNDNTQNDQAKFFDLHTLGIGYLNRARTVTPTQGKPYMSVSIAALHGRSDSPSYSYIDTRVVGSDALEFVKQHEDTINDRASKVLVRFKIGDGTADSYEVQNGDNKGSRNHVIKARLLQITWAKVNGVVVLQPNDSTGGDESQPSSEPMNEPSADQQPAVDSSVEDQPPADDSPVQCPVTVELDPNDPEFEVKRTRLKKAGYRWNRDQAAWVLPEAA